jgi:hypothetical protein
MKKTKFQNTAVVAAMLIHLFSSPVVAGVAICEEVGSRAFGQDGSTSNFERIDEFQNDRTAYEIRWSEADRTASVLVADQFFYESPFFRTTDDLVTFAVTDPTNTWLYSVYPKAKRAVVSHHMIDMFGGDGGVVVFSELLECKSAE